MFSNNKQIAGNKRKDSTKENDQPNIPIQKTSTRSRRNTNNEVLKVTEKNIKKEKLSTVYGGEAQANVNIKQEIMAPPTRPAPRKQKKMKLSTSVQIKKEKIDIELEGRPSDVIMQVAPVPVVDITDDTDQSTEEPPTVMRQTRTKTKAAAAAAASKRTKRKAPSTSEEEDTVAQTATTETRSNETFTATEQTSKAVMNATVMVDKPSNSVMNSTIVVANPKVVVDGNQEIPSGLMTDDESEDEILPKNNTRIPQATKSVKVKPVFSTYDQSPVKKKVEAFEKLNEVSDVVLQRGTRTKTKPSNRGQDRDKEETATVEPQIPQNTVKEKAKMFSPLPSRFVPKTFSTASKASRFNKTGSTENLAAIRSASALKASQAEARERERIRREKEDEALRKRELLIQAQIEQKKRRNEEKQLKAQQQREMMDKEKQKLRDEQERKRMLVKTKALEEKRREDERRLQQKKEEDNRAAQLAQQDEDISKLLQKNKQKQHQKPLYMTTPCPLLPTEDCYDSDDDQRGNSTMIICEWTKGKMIETCTICAFFFIISERNLHKSLKAMMAAGETIKNTMFSRQATTPDLQDIFEVIDRKKLKRTSSAVWHKAPRFTMLPSNFEMHDEVD